MPQLQNVHIVGKRSQRCYLLGGKIAAIRSRYDLCQTLRLIIRQEQPQHFLSQSPVAHSRHFLPVIRKSRQIGRHEESAVSRHTRTNSSSTADRLALTSGAGILHIFHLIIIIGIILKAAFAAIHRTQAIYRLPQTAETHLVFGGSVIRRTTFGIIPIDLQKPPATRQQTIQRKLKQLSVVGLHTQLAALTQQPGINRQILIIGQTAFGVLFLGPRIGEIQIYLIDLTRCKAALQLIGIEPEKSQIVHRPGAGKIFLQSLTDDFLVQLQTDKCLVGGSHSQLVDETTPATANLQTKLFSPGSTPCEIISPAPCRGGFTAQHKLRQFQQLVAASCNMSQSHKLTNPLTKARTTGKNRRLSLHRPAACRSLHRPALWSYCAHAPDGVPQPLPRKSSCRQPFCISSSRCG